MVDFYRDKTNALTRDSLGSFVTRGTFPVGKLWCKPLRSPLPTSLIYPSSM